MTTATQTRTPQFTPESLPSHRPWPLFAILSIALLLRVLAATFYGGAIDSEGAEYARIAQNLLHGHAYEGIGSPGTELVFAPLFPAMIAAASFITRDLHTGGRLVSILMGVLLIVPVFLIVQHLYSRRSAYIAVSLVALHPFLIYYSVTVHCEPTYLTIFFFGLYYALLSMRTQTLKPFLLAGIFFGLGYLIRPEALVISFVAFAATVLYGAFTSRSHLPKTTLRAASIPALSLALGMPYIVWFHSQTGQWRLEGKTPVNVTTRQRMLDGMNQKEASAGIDDNLNETGVWIQPNLATIRAFAPTFAQTTSYITRQVGTVARFVKYEVTRVHLFGTPVLLLLACVGLLRIRWRLEFAIAQLLFFTIIALSCFGLFFIYFYDHRFMMVPLIIAFVWASEGSVAIAEWTSSMLKTPAWIATAIIMATTAPILVIAAPSVRSDFMDMKRTIAFKTAGEWLDRQDPGAKIIMTSSSPLAFAANAEWVPFPYTTSSDVARRYLDKRKVNYIVMADSWDSNAIPYLEEWRSAFPNSRATAIYRVTTPIPLTMYKWNSRAQ